MRHVMIEGPGRVVVAEAPEPEVPGPDGAVVSVDATAICGSDMHFYDGDIDLGMGIPVGHEFLGTVLEAPPLSSTNNFGLYRSATVDPALDLTQLDELFVILPN